MVSFDDDFAVEASGSLEPLLRRVYRSPIVLLLWSVSQLPAIARFAILGDIHCEDVRLDLALTFAAKQSLDAVLSVGDVVDGRGDAGRCCTLLQQSDVVCVRGNHDRWWASGESMGFADGTPRDALGPDQRAWIAALPATRNLSTPLGGLLLCHGLGENDMVGVEPGDEGYALESNEDLQNLVDRAEFRLVVNGHTHSRMVRRFGRRFWIINAGTLKGESEPGFGIVDLPSRTVTWFQFGSDESIREVRMDSIEQDVLI